MERFILTREEMQELLDAGLKVNNYFLYDRGLVSARDKRQIITKISDSSPLLKGQIPLFSISDLLNHLPNEHEKLGQLFIEKDKTIWTAYYWKDDKTTVVVNAVSLIDALQELLLIILKL